MATLSAQLAMASSNIMRDQQNPSARICKFAQIADGSHRQIQIEPDIGSSGNYESGLVHKRAKQQDAPEHAAGQLMGIHALYLGSKPILGE